MKSKVTTINVSDLNQKSTIWRDSTGRGRERVRKQYAPDLEKKPVTWPYIKRFLGELKPIRGQVIAAILLMPVTAAGLALWPVATKLLVDGVIPVARGGELTTLAGGASKLPTFLAGFFTPGSDSIIWTFLATFAVAFVVISALSFLMRYLMLLCGEWLVARMRHKLHDHIQFLSVRYIEDTQVGGIISRVVGDVQAVRNLLFGGFLEFVRSIGVMIVLLGFLLYIDWWMTLASIVLVPGFALVFLRCRKRLRPAWRHIREEMGLLTARIAEVFGGAKVVKTFVKERHENSGFFKWTNDLLRKAMRVHGIHMGMHAGADLVAHLGRVLVLALGAWRVVRGEISLGDVFFFTMALGMFFQPMIQAVSINTQMQRAMASLERIYDVLDLEPEVREKPGALRVDRLEGDVVFENVSFRYDAESPGKVIRGVSFHARPGECVAIVGPSGAGKTTLTNLLARFYDVEKGRILVDGHDIRELELAPYRRNLAVVLQDTWLFNGSIRENIAYAVPDATEDDVRLAAEQANALEFIEKLPKGFDERVGERGAKLSGGQKQRLAIARAILADPRILILDEATSSLDSHSEGLIQEALERLMKGRTTLVIAHRLSTITNADRILVLEQGRVAESGTHLELLAAHGAYYRMFMEQYGRVRFLRNAVKRYAEHLVEKHGYSPTLA
jgi:ABC-type multidrug transport system fused ATPase/permease subunit